MRKLRIVLVLAIVLAAGLGGFAVAAEQKPETYNGLPIVIVVIDGKEVIGDVPSVILNGRAMVSLRSIMEALGAGVTWDAASETVTVTTDPAAEGTPITEDPEAVGALGSEGTATTTGTETPPTTIEEAYEAASPEARAAYEAACDAAYQLWSDPGHPGAFTDDRYDQYVAAIEAIQEAFEAATP